MTERICLDGYRMHMQLHDGPPGCDGEQHVVTTRKVVDIVTLGDRIYNVSPLEWGPDDQVRTPEARKGRKARRPQPLNFRHFTLWTEAGEYVMAGTVDAIPVYPEQTFTIAAGGFTGPLTEFGVDRD